MGGAVGGAADARWARLTWQSGDPDALAADLGRRLALTPERLPAASWRLRLGGEALDIVPWLREDPRDEPSVDGRLVFEPIRGGGPLPGPESAGSPGSPLTLAGVAWSTVDLDRAEAELEPWLLAADAAAGDGDAAPDPHLGARTRRRRTLALPGGTLILAEAATEGRLAASLARDGEGPCALYVRLAAGLHRWAAAARARGIAVSARRVGPLGPSVLLPGRRVAGPHILVLGSKARRGAAG